MNREGYYMGDEDDMHDLRNLKVKYLIRILIRDYNLRDIDEEFIRELVYNNDKITADDVSKKIIAKRRKGIIDTFLKK